MITKRIVENPFHKNTVKNPPKDAKYKQQTIYGNKLYYSESKQCYYEVIKR